MTNKKMTAWFPHYIKPARVGVYQIDRDTDAVAFWDGRFWGVTGSSIEEVICRGDKSSYQYAEWRGFKEKQK